jgi:hypothetical protein
MHSDQTTQNKRILTFFRYQNQIKSFDKQLNQTCSLFACERVGIFIQKGVDKNVTMTMTNLLNTLIIIN